MCAEPQLHSLVKSLKPLPKEGTITFDPNTYYWYIKLSKEWQNEAQNIAKLAFNFLKDTNKYTKSIEICKAWSLMITDADAVINCVTPPSITGLHISLDQRADDDNKPKQLIKGENVSFNINNIELFPTTRSAPENIDGQFTFDDGSRYYPTLWVLADIEFVDFSYNTRYPPHISLACIAVKLSVDEVEKFRLNSQNKQLLSHHDTTINNIQKSDDIEEHIKSDTIICVETVKDSDIKHKASVIANDTKLKQITFISKKRKSSEDEEEGNINSPSKKQRASEIISKTSNNCKSDAN